MLKHITVIFILLIISGCSNLKYGYTKAQAENKYLKVDVDNENFGYKRVTYIVAYRGDAIDSFIKEKGYPDFLYEFKTEDKEGFTFFYLKEGKAFVFVSKSWNPANIENTEIREFTDFEKRRFEN